MTAPGPPSLHPVRGSPASAASPWLPRSAAPVPAHSALASRRRCPGAHETTGRLGVAEVELIHRVVGDPGRLSEKWSQEVLARGLSEGEYVEIVGLTAMVMMMDTFTRAIGAPERPLPAPVAGEPTRYRPSGARKKAAWLPLVEPEDATEADGTLYPSPKAGYIYRGLSLVPQSLRDYWALANCHYMPGEHVYRFDTSIRAITRPQVEIIAARVSAMHLCAY
jgi:alkylhydroperoxidase family enzyme